MAIVKVLSSQLGDQIVSVLQTDGQPAELVPVDVDTSGGLVPLAGVLYVNNLSAVGGPDGSIGAPFTTLAAAIAAAKLAAVAATLLVSPGDYSAEAPQTTVGIPSLALVSLVPAAIGLTVLPAMDLTGTTETVAQGMTLSAGVSGDGILQALGCAITGNVTGTLNLLAYGGEIFGSVTAAQCEAFGTEFGPNSYDFHLSGTKLRLVGCPVADPTAANSIVFTGAAGTVLADALAAWTIAQGSATLTNGTLQTQSRGAQVQVTVATPVLAAAALGYVDVDVSATALAPLTTTDVVTVNPAADLHAAGAAGGFLASARVSAGNMVRLAFVGALAGGDVDFRIARA